MATSEPSDPILHQIDRLSSLPDELLVTILSLLPIRAAGRTSVLSRRFRHLCEIVWETSPSLELISRDFPPCRTAGAHFVTMAKQILLSRSPSQPLSSLRIELERFFRFSPYRTKPSFLKFFNSLYDKARSLGVRHLTIEGCTFSFSILPTCSILSLIFSITTLQSLSLSGLFDDWHQNSVIPFGVTLTNLKNLSIQTYYSADPAQLNRLLSQLPSLEVLSIQHDSPHVFSLSSQTIKQLNLFISKYCPAHNPVELSLPSLELLQVENYGTLGLPHIRADIPSLRKAVLHLNFLRQNDCSAVAGLLNSISHAQELILHLKESDYELDPFPILLEPGREPPKFPNLKHLEGAMCFHEHNFQAIVSLLHHSPALQSLKLVHKALFSMARKRKRKRDDWRSMLPQNADGNRNYVHLTNLHLGQRREFMKLAGKQCTPKLVQPHC
ncbi:F-box/FBD/LRR protein [Rhynchospora pubera]|uniref:F-box/FBD/LRR protein n=1 Tax=Rhynchospora pubera TaxID=906938 RepID=A0AAV8AHG0_9POAL|nr:F-box/FBD/LRR protein [Rhynchospora pubera]KAJ4733858.1 F-box/FBD/LRR protein [Rhynchospora pubera]KAJ4747905.1 F-box/FBD/LRR protein [Rhynchospora pubera]KAJ4799146.1 F-box/FBD/LRR protein [Rhynchospora pubera]